jgi:hypothetical protein
MKLAAGGWLRNQDEKILLQFSARMNRLRTELPLLG